MTSRKPDLSKRVWPYSEFSSLYDLADKWGRGDTPLDRALSLGLDSTTKDARIAMEVASECDIPFTLRAASSFLIGLNVAFHTATEDKTQPAIVKSAVDDFNTAHKNILDLIAAELKQGCGFQKERSKERQPASRSTEV